ncbi:tyrosine-type recombinase/integrase [Mailhella sp.]|uniref:tyrosine-type recombinase/integrase n=1 Tax=Mailhella sp. TaxID=1981029 RepID=UPI004062C659
MPRCMLTAAFVEELKRTKPEEKIIYTDEEYRYLRLEYRSKGKGTWYFRGQDEDGKMKLIRLGRLDELDVLEARSQAYTLKKIITHGGRLAARQKMRKYQMTFNDFIEAHYLPHASMRKRSWKAEEGVLRRHAMPFIGDMRLEDISRLTLARWLEDRRAQGLSPGTCNRMLFILKYVFNCARRWNFLEDSPARDVSALPDREFRERYLSEDEAHRLLQVLAATRNRQAARAIQLLLFTGARKSEILTARWENVDFSRRVLTVPLSKSGKPRYIPLSRAALRVLTSIPRRSEWLFPSPRTESHLSTLHGPWHKIRTAANLQDVRLHDLRHTFASFLVNSGCSLYEVQKILGHHDPKVTTRYAHLNQESLLKAAEMVGTMLSRRPRKKKEKPKTEVRQIALRPAE